jgi:sugar/nucleoside kinase (ribokinase family)
MRREDLEERLAQEQIRRDAYSLDGGRPSEAYVLSWDGKRWRTYYSERGQESDVHFFESESAACEHLLKLLLSDPSTR